LVAAAFANSSLPRAGSDVAAPPPPERREVGDAARVAGFGRALEQFSRLRVVLGDAGAGSIEYAEFDHRRGRALVRGLAPSGDGFHQLPVGGIGAAELIERAARRARGVPAIFDGGRDVRGRHVRRTLDVGRLVRIGGIGGEPVAQHEIGRLRVGKCRSRRDENRSERDAA
jgi:hypothetical protein